MPDKMKAIVVDAPGGPEVLKLKTVDRPKIKAGWSLVKIKGFGINHSEIFTRQGLSPSVTFPRILGIECVGVIEETTDEIILESDGFLQTSEAFDKILELIGPATVKDSLEHANEYGIVCSCGQLGGKWYLEEFDPIMELSSN